MLISEHECVELSGLLTISHNNSINLRRFTWLLIVHFITLLVNIGNVAVWMWILWNVLSSVHEEEENELNEGKE